MNDSEIDNQPASPEKTADRTNKFKFIVDQQHFETVESRLTGAQIKVVAHVDPSVQLFLEEPGPGSDQLINDDTTVELKEHGETRFYTMPRANMGMV
jgi:hypothetical protein